MNTLKHYLIFGILFCSLPFRLLAEVVSAVEVTDLIGNRDYRICTDAEKKKLEEEIKAEEKFFFKAMQDAMDEWKSGDKKKSFPASRLRKRMLKVLTTTGKQEEADAVIAKAEEQKKRSEANKMEEEKEILNRKVSSSKASHKGGKGGGNSGAAANLARQKEEIQEEKERDALAAEAEVILRKHLGALAGHEIPFFGGGPKTEKKAKKAPQKKKK